MNASELPKGQSQEVSTDGRPVNQPGIYKNKDIGATIITAEGDSGVIQADAILRTGGYERVGDVPTRLELAEMRKAQLLKDAAEATKDKMVEDAELKALIEAEKVLNEKAKTTVSVK